MNAAGQRTEKMRAANNKQVHPDDSLIRMMDQLMATKTKRKKTRPAVLSIHLRDFLHSSSMHGLKYAADKEATYVEK